MNPEAMLESICYRELTKYAASARLETEGESNSKYSLLGKGRIEALKVLKKRIQDAADKEGLGVDVVFLGLQGVHPPVEVAKDYQKVTGAIQEKQKLILDAEAEKISTLSTSTGSVQNAERLRDIIIEIANNEQSNDPNLDKIRELRGKLDDALMQTSGTTYATFSEAQIYAFQQITSSEADAKRFAGQFKAYRAAPGIYLLEQQISALEKSLQNIRKYVIMANEENKQITVIDLKDTFDASGMFNVKEYLKEQSGQ
jgi:regulator of protease activity HflC (stomatin/prohibitin superfamily)